MRVVHGVVHLRTPGNSAPPPLAVAIGNFDGFHRGHAELIRVTRAHAARIDGQAAVLTFTPHPARIFAPALAPPLIVSLERRLELLAEAGIDVTVVEPFTADFAAMPAETFVRDVLATRLGAREVVVGYDFSFGHKRLGNPSLLQKLGAELGLGVTVVPPVAQDGLTCSSTKIREFVLEGRVEGAALLLGRPPEITGKVVRGAGRGRAIGVPTANVEPEAELWPRLGIYAAWARILAVSGSPVSTHRAALSVGTNPTFAEKGEGSAISVEAHLLDFDRDLYGRRLRLELIHRLRDERRFDTVEGLLAQIRHDIAEVRGLLPDPEPGR